MNHPFQTVAADPFLTASLAIAATISALGLWVGYQAAKEKLYDFIITMIAEIVIRIERIDKNRRPRISIPEQKIPLAA